MKELKFQQKGERKYVLPADAIYLSFFANVT